MEAGVASIEITPGWIADVQRYTDSLQLEAIEAANMATASFHESVISRAKNDPQWSSLADNIEVWSEDGQLVIGVAQEEFVSQAAMLEYGDLDNAPNPLFRTLSSEARDAHFVARDHMSAKFGPANVSHK
jgi:hypothetical protein